MKILSAKQTQETDAYTIEHEPIASIDLMERASNMFVEAFSVLYPEKVKLAIVCGTGNNGGDGLAISRLLSEVGYDVVPIIVQPNEGGSKDFLINLDKLPMPAKSIRISEDIPDFSAFPVLIDAIFGSGLARPVTGLFAEVINAMNASSSEIIAIDIPSGLFMDAPAPNCAIIEANQTVSFQLPKLAFFFPANHPFVGHWQVVDIGLDLEFIDRQESSYSTIDQDTARNLLPPRSKFDHKGSFGHCQLVGGSVGKMGAVILAAEAVLRSGAGLVSVSIPRCGQEIMQTSLPEAMLVDQSGENEITEFNILDKANVVGLGPGLGTDKKTVKALSTFLQSNTKPLVIDADGINILSESRELIELLPPNTILTPHIKEFDRLAGESTNNWERLDKARALASRYSLILVLKGAHSAIITADKQISFNTSGNPGMATAGSGDVLLGVITGLLGQGCEPSDAAKLGVYIHGLAGDLAATEIGQRSMIAGDIIKSISDVFFELER